MDSVVVLLQSRRLERMQLLHKINHAIPAAGLLATGMQALAEGVEGAGLTLAVVEIVTSAMLIFAFARGVRAASRSGPREHGHSHGVDWIDIWAAGVVRRSRGTVASEAPPLAPDNPDRDHHAPARAVSRSHRELQSAETCRQDYRRRDLRRRQAVSRTQRWVDVASISVAGQVAEVRTRRGRVRRVDLADLRNADEVRAAFAEGSRRLAALRAQESLPAT